MNASSRVLKAGRVAVETSAVISLFRGEAVAAACFNEAQEIWMPVTVLGELYCGLRKCNNPQKERLRVREMRGECVVMSIDEATANAYSEVFSNLEAEGGMIPLNDVWIAAFAIRHEMPLLAKDDHFDRVERLDLVAL